MESRIILCGYRMVCQRKVRPRLLESVQNTLAAGIYRVHRTSFLATNPIGPGASYGKRFSLNLHQEVVDFCTNVGEVRHRGTKIPGGGTLHHCRLLADEIAGRVLTIGGELRILDCTGPNNTLRSELES